MCLESKSVYRFLTLHHHLHPSSSPSPSIITPHVQPLTSHRWATTIASTSVSSAAVFSFQSSLNFGLQRSTFLGLKISKCFSSTHRKNSASQPNTQSLPWSGSCSSNRPCTSTVIHALHINCFILFMPLQMPFLLTYNSLPMHFTTSSLSKLRPGTNSSRQMSFHYHTIPPYFSLSSPSLFWNFLSAHR